MNGCCGKNALIFATFTALFEFIIEQERLLWIETLEFVVIYETMHQ